MLSNEVHNNKAILFQAEIRYLIKITLLNHQFLQIKEHVQHNYPMFQTKKLRKKVLKNLREL